MANRLYLVVFCVGVSTLGAEIAAARLLAPFFGASTIVWANTIATVLVALSIGYWVGGSIADRRPTIQALCRWVLVGAAMVALVPLVAQPFLEVSVEAFDEIQVGAAVGSLIGVLALVAVPVLVLGAVAPWAIRLRVASVEDSGRTAGRLYALSTRRLADRHVRGRAAADPAARHPAHVHRLRAAAGGRPPRARCRPATCSRRRSSPRCSLLPPGVTKDVADARILGERETEYQYARVIELPDGERRLELNEGQAFHSVYRPDTVLTGNVWDGYLVAAVRGARPRRRARSRCSATAPGRPSARTGATSRETAIDGVEIDPELTEIGREWFGLRTGPGLRLIHEDARPFLRRTDRRYDAIFVDAYRQPYIPFYLTTGSSSSSSASA